MNMAMGPCLAWPRSHSNVRGWHVRMLDFQGSPPPQHPLLFFIPQQWGHWIRPLLACLLVLLDPPPQDFRSRQCRPVLSRK